MRLLADNLPPPRALPTLEEQMTQAYQNDPLAIEIFEALRTGAQRNRTLSQLTVDLSIINFSIKTDFMYLTMRSFVCESYRGDIADQFQNILDVNELSNH